MAKKNVTNIQEYFDFDDGGAYSAVVFGERYDLVSVEHIKQNVYLVKLEKDGNESSVNLSAEHPVTAEKSVSKRSKSDDLMDDLDDVGKPLGDVSASKAGAKK